MKKNMSLLAFKRIPYFSHNIISAPSFSRVFHVNREMSFKGDLKVSLLNNDHDKWIFLNGRTIENLSIHVVEDLNSFGLIEEYGTENARLVDARGCFLGGPGVTGEITGQNSVPINVENLPTDNFFFNTQFGGNHGHECNIVSAIVDPPVISVEAGGNHTHLCTIVESGEHTHPQTSIQDDGGHTLSASCSSSGGHHHRSGFERRDAMQAGGGWDWRPRDYGDASNNTFVNTDDNGVHSHSITVSDVLDHSHNINWYNDDGGHSHDINVESNGSHSHTIVVDPLPAHSHDAIISSSTGPHYHSGNFKLNSSSKVPIDIVPLGFGCNLFVYI